MNLSALSIISAILIGLGATFAFDCWALFVKHEELEVAVSFL